MLNPLRRPRNGIETLPRNRLARYQADAVRAVVNPSQGGVDLIDRGAGGVERLRREGVKVHSLLTLEGLLNYLLSRELITEAMYAKCLTWLESVREGDR